MVKVHKPFPKTIKKDGPQLKKIQTKIGEANPINKLKKPLGVAGINKPKNVKTKTAGLNRKLELLERIKETVSKKKPLAEKSVKNGEVKRPLTAQKKSEQVKKPATNNVPVAKSQNSLKKILVNSDLTKVSSAPKKKPVEAKAQQTVKKSVVKKNSAVEKESGKKYLSKQTQLAISQQPLEAKAQQSTKQHVANENSVFGKQSDVDKKKSLRKTSVVAEEHRKLVKKPVTKKSTAVVELSEANRNVIPKKKLMNANGHVADQKAGKKSIVLAEPNKADKTGQKKINSKVQKKLSVEKKNQTDLKNKVQKNICEVKKIFQKDQGEIIKSEEKKIPLYEQQNFDEDKFRKIVSFENIKKVCKALKDQVEKEVSEKKKVIFSDYKYYLNVACYKIPNCPKRMVKLNLKHALVDTEVDDVVLIVPDLQRGSKVDYEPTIQHYDDILRKYKIENIKVLPFNQLRNEYSSFEAKRKLYNTYDHFLCDGRIVGQVVGFCGKHFQKPGATFHAVNLSNPKVYKQKIRDALKRTAFRQLKKGNLSSILVGNHRFTMDQLAENVGKVIYQLKLLYPGGYANIRNLYIRIDITGTSALPLYVSLTGAPEEVPNIIGPREQRMLKLKKQANDVLSKFSMSKTGEFVKLSKTQAKRKQEIRETREALTSKENVEGDDVDEIEPPLKKSKKKQVELENSDDSEVSDNDDLSEENDDDAVGEVYPTLKKSKKQVQLENSDDSEVSDNDDVSEEGGDDDVGDVYPPLKKSKRQVQLENSDDSEVSDNDDVSEEDREESDEVSDDDIEVSQGESEEDDEDDDGEESEDCSEDNDE